MFEVGKKYKIQDQQDIYYTATIIEETEHAVIFIDLNGEKLGLAKQEIKRWKQMENSTGSEF